MQRLQIRKLCGFGRDLIAVKARLQHGRFLPWIEAEFGMSEDSAGRFMAVARKLGHIPQIAEFKPSALYLLASAKPEVVSQVEARAEAGETIRVADLQAKV